MHAQWSSFTQVKLPIKDFQQGTHIKEFALKDTGDSSHDIATIQASCRFGGMPIMYPFDVFVQCVTLYARAGGHLHLCTGFC